MSEDLDFFSSGGQAADGFANQPSGNGIDFASMARTFPIDGSTDFIRIPRNNFQNSVTLGWRRIDATGSGGGSEWLVSWTEIATEASVVAATLAASASFYGCSVLSGKIYLAVFDPSVVIDGAEKLHIVKVDMTTGVIDSITPVKDTNVTILAGGDFDDIFNSNIAFGSFWEILANGDLRFATSISNDAAAEKGVSLVTLDSSDYETLISEEILFNTDQPNAVAWDSPISYVSLAGDLIIAMEGVTAWIGATRVHVGVKDQGTMRLNVQDFAMATDTSAPNFFISNFFQTNNLSATTVARNMISDNDVLVNRKTDETAANDNSRIQVKRTVLETWLKRFIRESGGVIL